MKSPTILTALGSSLAAAGLAQSATLYDSDTDFGQGTNSTGNDITVAGWAGFYGRPMEGVDPAVNTTAAPISGTYKTGLFDGNSSSGGLNNYIYFQKTGSGITSMDLFAHTSSGSNFASFTPDTYSAAGTLSATWSKNGDTLGSGGYYVTVLVGGTWYASTTNIGSTASPSFNFLSSDWVEVFDDLSAPLDLGTSTTASSALFAGQDVDGFGFFVEDLPGNTAGNRTLRLDNVVITGVVPEPSSALLGLCGAALLLRRRRA